jgi:hypothetical protein
MIKGLKFWNKWCNNQGYHELYSLIHINVKAIPVTDHEGL